MATLASERISVTLPGEVSAFFRRRAREANTTVDREIATMAWAFMDDEGEGWKRTGDGRDEYLRDVYEKVAAAEQSVAAGRVMDGFESVNTIRAKHGL